MTMFVKAYGTASIFDAHVHIRSVSYENADIALDKVQLRYASNESSKLDPLFVSLSHVLMSNSLNFSVI